ncbi:MAG: nucleotidyltransferase family protein [Anaerolineales bacterium]|nr:nucleotidyltransferase family protein [Anaerolineales bacterium]
MTPEDRILLNCARQNFSAAHVDRVQSIYRRNPISWEMVALVARQNGVSPLVYTNLATVRDNGQDIDSAVLNSLKKDYIRNVFVKKGTMAILSEIAAFLTDRNIALMVVKGAALDLLVYDRPWYTVLGDVDLVLKVRKKELPEYVCQDVISKIETYNRLEDPHRVHFEYDFYEHHDITMNGMLQVDAQRIWNDAVQIQMQGQDVWVMSKEDMLIAGAINSCRKRYFRLKSILDIATIVEKFADLDWGIVANKAQDYGCQPIVFAALSVAEHAVGCQTHPEFFKQLNINPIRAWIIRSLIEQLFRFGSLKNLSLPPNTTPEWRRFSWGLLLSYSTYQWNQVIPKVRQLFRAWYNQNRKI